MANTNIVQTASTVRGTSSITLTLENPPTTANSLLIIVISEGAPPSAIAGWVLQSAYTTSSWSSSTWGRTVKNGDGTSQVIALNSPSVGLGWELTNFVLSGGA